MAERRAGTTREQRRCLLGAGREREVPEDVDAVVAPVQQAALDPMVDGVGAESGGHQFSVRDRAGVGCRDSCDTPITGFGERFRAAAAGRVTPHNVPISPAPGGLGNENRVCDGFRYPAAGARLVG
jgi:hypothetical protein